MTLDFGLYRAADGGRVSVPSAPVGVGCSTNRKGPAAASAFFPMNLRDSFRLYNAGGLLHAIIADDQAGRVWAGRVEDVAIVPGGVRVGAFGYSRTLSDGLYTALWSKTGTAEIREMQPADYSGHTPEKYSLDNNNRVFIALTKNTVYGVGNNAAGMVYQSPDDGETSISYIRFSYTYNLPTNWALRVAAADQSFGSVVTSSITAVGGSGSGTFTWDLSATPKKLFWIQVYNNTGSNYTNTAETGDYYAIATSLRCTATDASIYASDIAAALATYAANLNSGQIAARSIVATSTDLQDELYEDMRPADILDDLAGRHTYEWGVDARQVFYFRPRGTVGRNFFVDAAALELERSAGEVWNKIYATYQDANGRTLRTNSATDATSITAFGLTRTESVRARTTSATQAETVRDTRLAQAADYAIRARVTFDRLYDAAGNERPLHALAAGDQVTIRNLPATATTDIENIATFRVDYSNYDAAANALDLEPDTPTPTLVTLIAEARR